MSVAYTPWPPALRFGDASRGDVLEYYGSGGIDFGYLGGVYDDTSRLIYLGSGQYYDPVTGRMLTRGAGQGNPYKPGAFDPAGMMVAPGGRKILNPPPGWSIRRILNFDKFLRKGWRWIGINLMGFLNPKRIISLYQMIFSFPLEMYCQEIK